MTLLFSPGLCAVTYAQTSASPPAAASTVSAEEAYAKGSKAYDEKRYGDALRWFRAAADQGHARAQMILGTMYLGGLGTAKDSAQAMRLLRPAADRGEAMGQYLVGLLYYEAKDYGQARQWLRLAADQGQSDAQYYLGYLHRRALGGPKDLSTAKALLRQSADKGNASGQTELGLLYAEEEHNDVEAALWFRKAADQGNADAQAALGIFYVVGRGGLNDPVQGAALVRKAADQGLAVSQHSLGLLYEGGLGVPRDLAQARAWMQKAAAGGDPDAQAWLKKMAQTQNRTQTQTPSRNDGLPPYIARDLSPAEVRRANGEAFKELFGPVMDYMEARCRERGQLNCPHYPEYDRR